MQSTITKTLRGAGFPVIIAAILLFIANISLAQSTTINTTVGSTGYNGNNNSGANGFITFAVTNNSGGDLKITEVGNWCQTLHNNTTSTVWYSSTSLSGPVTLATPTWTIAGSATVTGVSAAGVHPVVSNMNFIVPNGVTYRIAVHTNASENNYTLGTATPNNFTAGGMTLYTGDYQISGQNVGYAVGNNPRFFTGYITFEPAAVPCDDTINSAVVLGPKQICPNKQFALSVGLQNGINIAGLSYQWQFSNNGFSWSNFTGVPNPNAGGLITDVITQPRWYRCKITCSATNKTFTTPVHKVDIAPFYYCYCDNSTTTSGANIGNVTIINLQSYDTTMNNGKSTPLYNNPDAKQTYTPYHNNVSWPCFYRDTTYRFLITQIHSAAVFQNTWVQAYIDFNRDGLYNPNTEKIFTKAIDGSGNPIEVADVSIKIPSTAEIGETGMRIIMSKDSLVLPPCNIIAGDGEVEDYVVKICYRPCDGPVDAGTVVSTDTSMCPEYEYKLTDTTYEKARSAFDRAWQISGDNISWFNVDGGGNKDTLQRVFTGQPLYYRLRAICPLTADTTYSVPAFVNAKPGYKCYCYSKATGGINTDSSDIGSIKFGDISTIDGGPHILNPKAVKPRTDHTDNKFVEFYTDSTYAFYVYHTMKAVEHGDAKVTIFMDFNNNKQYDIPEERIYTGYTTIGSHTLVDSIKIPTNAIRDVPTGARFIINNDIAPSRQSDSACGGYLSGETEDFIVIFRKKVPKGIGEVAGKLSGFGVHPNPTSGRFTISFSAIEQVRNAQVRVTNMTGQVIFANNYTVDNTEFVLEVGMDGQPSGVYFVELNADGERLIRKLVIQ